jgi:hypothetical protein
MRPLKQLLADRYLRREKTSPEEISDLLQLVRRDLELGERVDLQPDWRFNILYNAALQLCKIALRASGLRSSSRGSQHKTTIQCLPLIMGDSQSERAEYLDSCRLKRNKAEYDMVGVVTASDIASLLAEVRDFQGDIIAWLEREYPQLLA